MANDGLHADLFVVDGAAMALAFDSRRLTTDIDGVFEPKMRVDEAVQKVVRKHPELADTCLNDAVKGMHPGPAANAPVVLDAPGITVSVASAEYLLALKVHAARMDRAVDDFKEPARQCGLNTADEVLDVAARIIGPARLQPKAQLWVRHLFSE